MDIEPRNRSQTNTLGKRQAGAEIAAEIHGVN
jgi:hypothetical protein